MRERIIIEATKMFTRFGVKSVRLQDIVQTLGSTKKTLYKYFRNKEELIKLILESQFKGIWQGVSPHSHYGNNAIDEAFFLWDRLVRYQSAANPNLLLDIKRYYPAVWELYKAYQTEYVDTVLLDNILWGKEQGLYRSDLNESEIAHLWAWQSNWDKVLKDEATKNTIKHHFVRGLLTSKGVTVYESLTL